MKLQFHETGNLWEGVLETPAVTYRGAEGVAASIGEPFQWADGECLGKSGNRPSAGIVFIFYNRL
jgi:hypothetical protein